MPIGVWRSMNLFRDNARQGTIARLWRFSFDRSAPLPLSGLLQLLTAAGCVAFSHSLDGADLGQIEIPRCTFCRSEVCWPLRR